MCDKICGKGKQDTSYLIQYSNRKAGLKLSFDFILENKLVAE